MKNTFKTVVLLCLLACMLLTTVACNVVIAPIETGTNDQSTDEVTTPDGSSSDDLYKLEMQTVFEIAKEAGYTGTLEELIAMFKGEKGPAGVNGITPHIGQNGNWWVGDTDLGISAQGLQGPQGPQGSQGPQGEPGRGILKMEMVDGELIVYYTDGTSQNLGPIVNGTPEKENLVYIIKVTDENNQPIAGVELLLYCDGTHGGTYINLPATEANGYTYSPFIEQKEYTVRVARADGYEFDADIEYQFVPGSNVAYIILAPESIVTPPTDDPDGLDMPEKVDLDGYVYRAYVRSNVSTDDSFSNGNPYFYCEDFWVNPEEGEPEDALEFAVYRRNQDIENDYNVKIRQVSQTINMVQELAIYIQNGDPFDLTIILAKSAAQAATQNLLTEFKGLPNLNLSHEAYDQNSIRELQMGGKLYYLSGDMNISTLDSVAPTVVNLDLYEVFEYAFVEEFDGDELYGNIYNVVKSGKWTIDTMLKMAKLASLDADTTDGALGASENDIVGYFQYNASAVYYFYGAGGRITQMNDEGSPEFVIKEKQDVFDYIFDKFHPMRRDIPYPNGFSPVRKVNFITNANTLFTEMTLWDVRKDLYMNATFNYGLLPNPTYQEGDDYNSVVYFYNTVHLWAIPKNVEDLDNAQLMMDVMAAYSNLKREGSTMEGYYTRTLSFTVARDPEAREIMDIIKNSTVYDIALLYDWGGWATELSELWYKRNTNNHGILVQQLPHAQAWLEETIELFRNPGAVID